MRPRLYAEPALYDLIHADGTDDEVWLLDRIARLHGASGLKTALEPACGTGRYLAGLLRRGWSVEGYDLSADMARYAAARLKKYGKRAVVRTGDMRTYETPARFGLVFNLLSTFRHLMNDRDALAHLRRCAESLAPGGVFVLGLDLAAYGKDEPDEETWTGRAMNHVMMTLPADRRRRRERIMNFITVPGRKVIESHYDLRSYDARELKALLAKSPLELVTAYSYGGKPAALGGPERALWLVLRRRASARPVRRSA
ncbi:MAG: class I SAM-dependent methyltransferase [Elusimicrobiota bacterium]|nr:class I SAM-dependent methyltransferase [Elusimicrobiota bacterium]